MRTYRPPQVSRSMLRRLCADLVGADSLEHAAERIERFRKSRRIRKRSAWYRSFGKLSQAFRAGEPRFRVFTKGNAKLPYWSFSALPEFTCPGAGACLGYCYSFRAWRYPAAFCRQAQNTLFLRHARTMSSPTYSIGNSQRFQSERFQTLLVGAPRPIVDAWKRLPMRAIVRLYVDGDFCSIDDLGFWFSMLRIRPDVRAYGYSKSLHLFQEWAQRGLPFPTNYALNLSSGSRWDGLPIVDEVAALPIVRGTYLSVPVHGNYAKGFKRFEDPAYHAEVRQVARQLTGERVFSCPGSCGNCLVSGHACGSDRFRGVTIAIGEH